MPGLTYLNVRYEKITNQQCAITRVVFVRVVKESKGANMKLKSILPYLMFGSLAMLPKSVGEFHDTDLNVSKQLRVETTLPSQQDRINQKAQELCDTYIDLVLQGQENIKNAKGSHRNAVLREFPGAVPRWYCIYGQYTQLNRAVSEMGDTLHLIPFSARHACPTFRSEMKKKYGGVEYAGALHNGKMFKSDVAYNQALQAFLKHNHVTDSTPDSIRNKVIAKFEKNNFSAELLHPGAILIIQKSATPSNTHAVMFLGRGHVVKGEFVPDANGQFIYAGYNNESIDDIFKVFNTNYIFAADILTIASVEYSKELQKIQNMNNEDLFHFVYDVPSDMYAAFPGRQNLSKMATEKYFDKRNYNPPMPIPHANFASFAAMPGLQNFFNRTR